MFRLSLFAILLFLSGLSALIFETLWLRLSGLVFGNSVWSAALILSSFMAGLALGNTIGAYLRSHQVRPLQFYAGLEVVIAITGCTIVFGLSHLGEWIRPVFQMLQRHDLVLNALRLLLSFSILLLPTTAMGLTLPVLLNDARLRSQSFSKAMALLYGVNTLGAVAGALISEIYLVRTFGILGTSLAAGGMNCVAAALAFSLARFDTVADIDQPGGNAGRSRAGRVSWRLLWASFGSGSILLCLEVVWFRFLRLYVASSSSSFAMMLAVVLGGIGVGGIISGALPRRPSQGKHLISLLFVAASMSVLLSYILFPGPTLQHITNSFYLESWREITVLSVALMFPAALLSGVLFPFIAARIQDTLENRMNSVGLATLFNTAGAAIGPLVAGFLLLPNLGFQSTLILCAAGYLALGLLTSDLQSWSFKWPHGVVMPFLCALLGLLFLCFPYQRDQLHFANVRKAWNSDGSRLTKKIEGNSDTYQLLQRDLFGEPYYYRLTTNAFSMASTDPFNQRYMRTFAYLPLALRPEAKDALLICYGCGVTADALVHASGIKHVDLVDISREVLTLANFYTGASHSRALEDPRVTKFIQDGRFFLQVTPRYYDIITGEPPPPKVAGSVNLYTEEFFSLMQSRLKNGGIATFWLPINELTVSEAKAILRAFHNVFANASVWANADHEWIMMGINGPGRALKEEEFRHLWSDPATHVDLARVGIEVPEQMAALFLMDGPEIDRITKETEPLVDFYPKRLSDTPPDLKEVQKFARPYMEAPNALRAFLSSHQFQQIWPATMMTTSLAPFFLVRETRYLSWLSGSNKLAELDLYLRQTQLRVPVLEALRTDEFRLALAQAAAAKSESPPPEAIPDLVAGALAKRDIPEAIRLLQQKKERGLAVLKDDLLLIYLYCLNGNVAAAEQLAGSVPSVQKDWLVDWLWEKLQAEFGFRPPA